MAFLAAATFAGAGPVREGGWWTSIQLGAPLWAPGLRVSVIADQALFPSIEAAERAFEHGSYHAYLLTDFDDEVVDRALGEEFRRGWWELGDATATRLGPVALTKPDSNMVRARARFTVPDVDPGRYRVMLCTDGCEESFADVIPAPVKVIEDRVAAALSGEVEQLRNRLDRTESALHARTWRLKRRVNRLTRYVKELEAPAQESSQDAGSPAERSSAGGPILLGSTGVIAVGMALVLWRRRTRAPA